MIIDAKTISWVQNMPNVALYQSNWCNNSWIRVINLSIDYWMQYKLVLIQGKFDQKWSQSYTRDEEIFQGSSAPMLLKCALCVPTRHNFIQPKQFFWKTTSKKNTAIPKITYLPYFFNKNNKHLCCVAEIY